MEQSRHQNLSTISQLIGPNAQEIDTSLPGWARRSNPIVRRELGAFWKRLLPNTSLLAKVLAAQVVMVLVMPLELMMTLTIPLAMLGLVMSPVVLLIYGRVVVGVANAAAGAMVNAYNHHTLDLLRVTPISLDRIVLGKIAAGIWRRMEDVDMVLIGLTAFSLPFLTAYNLAGRELMGYNVTARLAIAGVLLVLPLRVVLEPFMAGAVAVAAGTLLPTRAAAVVTTLSFMIFYYLMLTVPLFGALGGGGRLLLEMILPLMLPIGIAWGAVQVAQWRIESQ